MQLVPGSTLTKHRLPAFFVFFSHSRSNSEIVPWNRPRPLPPFPSNLPYIFIFVSLDVTHPCRWSRIVKISKIKQADVTVNLYTCIMNCPVLILAMMLAVLAYVFRVFFFFLVSSGCCDSISCRPLPQPFKSLPTLCSSLCLFSLISVLIPVSYLQ